MWFLVENNTTETLIDTYFYSIYEHVVLYCPVEVFSEIKKDYHRRKFQFEESYESMVLQIYRKYCSADHDGLQIPLVNYASIAITESEFIVSKNLSQGILVPSPPGHDTGGHLPYTISASIDRFHSILQGFRRDNHHVAFIEEMNPRIITQFEPILIQTHTIVPNLEDDDLRHVKTEDIRRRKTYSYYQEREYNDCGTWQSTQQEIYESNMNPDVLYVQITRYSREETKVKVFMIPNIGSREAYIISNPAWE